MTCSSVYFPENVSPKNVADGFVTVVSFEAGDDESLSLTSVASDVQTVYASAQALYLASDQSVYNLRTPEELKSYKGPTQATVIHKFTLSADGPVAQYAGSGAVPGKVVNQFALDEYSKSLRVATSWSDTAGKRANGMFVLKVARYKNRESVACGRAPGRLTVVGSLDGLAKNEDIRSVRYDGERGFVVTFMKTDPLFALDLSNAKRPRLLGELKVPGFSTYMHFMDEKKSQLLTVGFDADETDGRGLFTGMLLQIFDVSDMRTPSLKHKKVIGTRGTTSAATADHLAFNFMPESGLLALPLGICDGGGQPGAYGTELTFNGLMVVRASAKSGFKEVGRIDHRDGAAQSDSTQKGLTPRVAGVLGCNNWWLDPNSKVERSVVMDDFLYSIDRGEIKAVTIKSLQAGVPARAKKSVRLADPDFIDATDCSSLLVRRGVSVGPILGD